MFFVIIHAMPYCSLYMTLNYFILFFYYRENDVQNLGYHFCQIFQIVMPILKPIVSSILINL